MKEIYYTKGTIALFVYCTAEVSKTRFIVMSLAPEILLGIIPTFVGILLNRYLPCRFFLVWMFCSLSAVLMGIGDNYNVYNAVNQVPAGSMIFNNGLHSYWKEKQTVKENVNSRQVLSILMMSVGLLFMSQYTFFSFFIMCASIFTAMFTNKKICRLVIWINCFFILYLAVVNL